METKYIFIFNLKFAQNFPSKFTPGSSFRLPTRHCFQQCIVTVLSKSYHDLSQDITLVLDNKLMEINFTINNLKCFLFLYLRNVFVLEKLSYRGMLLCRIFFSTKLNFYILLGLPLSSRDQLSVENIYHDDSNFISCFTGTA